MMKSFRQKPFHKQIVAIPPVAIMITGLIVLSGIILLTYNKFDTLANNLAENDFDTLNRISYVLVEMGEIHEQVLDIYSKSKSELDEEGGVYVESQKALDRIRRLISDVKGYKMTYLHQMYNPQDHNPDDIKNYILRQLRVFLSKHTSALTMVTVDLELSEKKLNEADDIYRNVVHKLESFSKGITEQVGEEFYLANKQLKNNNLIFLAVVVAVALLIIKLLADYVAKIGKNINNVNKSLEALAEDKDTVIPPLGDNEEMNRVIQSLMKYQQTQKKLHKTLSELTEMKENLEVMVDERTKQLEYTKRL